MPNGQEARLYLGHVLMENRQGIIVDAMLTQADGTAERDVTLLMLYRRWRNRRRIGRRGPMTYSVALIAPIQTITSIKP